MTDHAPPLRAGIVGTGFVASVHGLALRALGVPLVAVCGRTTEAADSFAARLNVPARYTDLADMLRAERLAVLHVCTPNHLHAEQTVAALERGVHVVCEKPLATSPEDGARMLEAAERHSRIGVTVYHSRGFPMVEHARELVRSGRIGSPYVVHGRYAADIAFSAPHNWRRVAAASGPSYATADLGTHWTDLVEHVTQLRIEEVFADFRSFAEPRADAGEDYAALLCRLESGAAATAHFSAISAGRKSDCVLELEGSAGGLSWRANAPNELLLRSPGRPSAVVTKDDLPGGSAAARLARLPAGLVEGYRGAFENLFRSAYRAMAGDDEHEYPSFADGYRGLRVLDAAIRSAGRREWVGVAPA